MEALNPGCRNQRHATLSQKLPDVSCGGEGIRDVFENMRADDGSELINARFFSETADRFCDVVYNVDIVAIFDIHANEAKSLHSNQIHDFNYIN